MVIPPNFSYPVQHEDTIWFYITDTGLKLGESFLTWADVKAGMIKKGILYYHNNISIFVLANCQALEEKLEGLEGCEKCGAPKFYRNLCKRCWMNSDNP